MNRMTKFKRAVLGAAMLSTTAMLGFQALADAPIDTYDRLLPLEGGSNFRDLGGYTGTDGKTVAKGLLFRSGAPSSLTDADIAYLDQFDFEAVVDLRSSEELDLYPNRWASESDDIDYRNVDYSIVALAGEDAEAMEEMREMASRMDLMYRNFPTMLKPQLTLLFDSLLTEDGPVMFNCSAGQDRTGVASGIVLTLLGVDREVILQDYLLSTQYRRPVIERGNVDLAEKAKTNAFAAMMLQAGAIDEEPVANPLYMEDGTPFLHFAFEEIEEEWGSVEAYAEQELGVDEQDIAVLRAKYLR